MRDRESGTDLPPGTCETGTMQQDDAASAKIPVLVAEDDIGLARSIDRVLSGEGFAVTLVHDGASAVKTLAEKTFDVILSDIQMPEMTGVQMLRAVRTRDLDIPVILMTSDPSVDTAIEALELGALRYLRKPVPQDELIATLRRASQLRRLARMKREAFDLLGRASTEAGDRAGLMANFDRALAGIWIAFQPIVGSRSSEVVAYEALLRTTDPSLPNPPATCASSNVTRAPSCAAWLTMASSSGFTNRALITAASIPSRERSSATASAG